MAGNIQNDDLVKVLANDAAREPRGVATVTDLSISGSSGAKSILGTYSIVVTAFQDPQSQPLPDNAYVLGDTASHVYEFLPTGDFNVDPEGDTYNGFGLSLNWIDLTVREWLTVAIDNKASFLWNVDISASLAHPVSMYGSNGLLYNSVSGGNLNDDPINGDTDNWILLLDPSILAAFPGSENFVSVSTVPNGYLEQDGTYQSKALYPNLYEFLKDGNTECIFGETVSDFRLPDKRGLGLRGWNHGRTGDFSDPMASGTTITGTTTNGSQTVTGLSSAADLELYMVVIGDGIVAGTIIQEINYESNTITLSISATASGIRALDLHSRWDRGDGTIPAVYDDNPGTPQRSGFPKHRHRGGSHSHSGNGGDSSTNGTRIEPASGSLAGNPTTGVSGAIIDYEGNATNDTRMNNMAVMFLIKT